MSNGNGMTMKGPWWITVIERTGSLGLVLLMLVGGYFLAKEFTSDMRGTWRDIHTIIQRENEEASRSREASDKILETLVDGANVNQKFLTNLGETITSRLDSMERRIDAIEAKVTTLKEG